MEDPSFNLKDLKVLKSWSPLPWNTFGGLVKFMPWWLRAVSQTRGRLTQYCAGGFNVVALVCMFALHSCCFQCPLAACEQLLGNASFEYILASDMIAAALCQYTYMWQFCLPFKVISTYSHQVIHNITDSDCDLNLEECECFEAS